MKRHKLTLCDPVLCCSVPAALIGDLSQALVFLHSDKLKIALTSVRKPSRDQTVHSLSDGLVGTGVSRSRPSNSDRSKNRHPEAHVGSCSCFMHLLQRKFSPQIFCSIIACSLWLNVPFCCRSQTNRHRLSAEELQIRWYLKELSSERESSLSKLMKPQ